jgi:ADP-dependent NAD(P)H-hydrate dehydratase
MVKKILPKFVKNKLPKRDKNSNKSHGGHALIIGGSQKFFGAGIISALSATRSGAGYIHLMCDYKKFPWLSYPDFIIHSFSISEIEKINPTSIGIGPGLGLDLTKKKLLLYLIEKNFLNVVVDADALTLLSLFTKKQSKLPPSWILTPHPGELARLLKVKISAIVDNPKKYIEIASEIFGCHIILKGPTTFMIDDQKKIYSINEGHPCLAKAGSGDVLTGMITALLAQKLSPKWAMICAVMIHARASQLYVENGGDELSMRPMDLIDLIPQTLKSLR